MQQDKYNKTPLKNEMLSDNVGGTTRIKLSRPNAKLLLLSYGYIRNCMTSRNIYLADIRGNSFMYTINKYAKKNL